MEINSSEGEINSLGIDELLVVITGFANLMLSKDSIICYKTRLEYPGAMNFLYAISV